MKDTGSLGLVHWDDPEGWYGEGVRRGCHFLLQHMKVKSESEVMQSCPTLSDPMDCIHLNLEKRPSVNLEWILRTS